jgi:hypothetical protein
VRALYYALARWTYHIYAELFMRIWDLRYRNDAPLPPIPCQICGGAHHERYCPNAKRLGFPDRQAF